MIPPTRKSVKETTNKIHVSELQLGMYISKLDRPWIETPFLMQGFLVECLEDIDLIAEFCEHIWIDIKFEEYTQSALKTQSRDNRPTYSIRYINKVPQSDEHKRAIGMFREARSNTKSFLDSVRLGVAIDAEHIKETVNDCVLSVIRNADALQWIAKMKSEDEFTADHCLNVCILAITFGRELGMDEHDLFKLGMCGIMHDIGHARIDPRLLRKKEGFTDKEIRILQAHTVYGRNLIMSCHGVPNIAIDVAYNHHEKIDGTGYPRQVKGSAIPFFARIIAIVDAYEEMISCRDPEEAMASTEALKIIYKARGTHFDEKLVLDYIRAIGMYPPGSLVELVNGKVGIVLETNYRNRHLPKVFITLNEKKMFGREQVLELENINTNRLDKSHLIKKSLKDGEYGIRIKDYKDKGLILG